MRKTITKRLRDKFTKQSYILGALMLVAGMVLPFLTPAIADAYGQVTTRSITMSSTLPGATGVTYKVAFTPHTTGTIGGIVIDFCDNDPIIGDTCSTSGGSLSLGGTPTVSNLAGDISGFTVDGHSTTTTLILSDGTPASESSASPITFWITNVTNPNYSGGACTDANGNCAFYARISTWDTQVDADNYTASATTGLIDAGGVALTTAQQITITAKVQEVLNFCVYTSGSGCSGGGSSITLGNHQGVLSSAGPFVDKTTHYDIQTNAQHGAVINAESPHSLEDSNGDIIQADAGVSGMNTSSATFAQSVTDSPQFGFCTYEATGANLTPQAPYSGNGAGLCAGTTQTAGPSGTNTPGGDNSAYFAFDESNLNSQFGEEIATAVAGTTSTGIIVFIGNISNTNIAGIYSTTLDLVATGTY